jgi:ribosomal protein L32
MNSTRENIKIHPTSSSTLTSRAMKSFNIDEDKQSLKKFISNSQTDFSSKIHQNIRWIQHSATDFKSISMTDMTSMKDFEYQDHINQTLKCTNDPSILSEDEDDRELLSAIKTFMDQGTQAVLEDVKPKKKSKSSHSKKTKSNSKRAKQANVVQIPPSTLSVSLPNRVTFNGDVTTLTSPMRAPTSIAKNEENNGTKSIITVDTSKARSNLEVVRLCLRELGWKEVQIFNKLFQLFFLLYIFSLHIIQLLIQIFIGIHHHFMKEIQILHLILVELINFLVLKEKFFLILLLI